jgi:hypothetical protein
VALHLADDGRLHGLRVGVLEPLCSKRHLSEDGSWIHHGQRELPSVRCDAVDPHPSFLEHEERLAALLWGVKDLAPLIMGVRDAKAELLYLFSRERLQDVHHGEEAQLFFWR